MNNKKAQITVFVIVGLVLLIIFIIFLAVRRTAEPKTTRVQEILNELETGSIKNHVTNCVIQTAMDGLEKIGANGGVIYDFEGGTIPFSGKILGEDYINHTVLGKSFLVAYALKQNTICPDIRYETPDYPSPGISLNDAKAIYNSECLFSSSYSGYDGVYGQNTMNKLCYVARESGCKGFATGIQMGLTIQKQLEDYVAEKLPVCVDFSAFSTRIPASIYPEADPDVEVNIREGEIIFLVEYPVKISFENQEPVTKLLNYQTSLKVRLGAIYNFLYNALTWDSKIIEFDINNEYIRSFHYKDGFVLTKINNPCLTCDFPYNQDDIIEVTDSESKVKGRNYLFRAAIKNRRPALDLIEGVSQDVSNPNQVVIPLRAFDPDDEDLTYYFLAQEPGGCWRGGMNIQNSRIRFNTIGNDVGNHYIGVLVVDDSGLFDYQKFWINVTDMIGGMPGGGGMNLGCLAPCPVARAGCINRMPNCFWVKDNAFSDPVCKSINSLDSDDYIII